MPIKPTQLSIKLVFEQNHTFQVPKYQRGYAWDDDAIEDFIEDIWHCLNARALATPKQRHHFFGGVVTVRQDVPKSNRSNYEVIDGQQRLASFVMLAAVVVRNMENMVGNLTKKGTLSAGDKKVGAFLAGTIENLRTLYLVYRDNIELEYVEVPKLMLSKADDEFFQKVIIGEEANPERASHERILVAWTRLSEFINTKVLSAGVLAQNAKRLQLLVNTVLAEDCNVIFMCSDTRSEAYQIFQVLNDRGVHLTDGDLLRANTMELLDHKDHAATQNSLAACWDSVLAYTSGDIDKYLPWYYSSHEGKRPKFANLADQFLEFRFKCKDKTTVGKQAAKAMLAEVRQMDDEFACMDTLCAGDWPYDDPSSKVTNWDRERLRMLVVHLKHTNAIPLLLSLRLLDAAKFADAITAIERFVFRYKTIGNAHIGKMTDLYLKHANDIRNKNGSYAISALRGDLRTLVEQVVPNSVFETNLREVRYSPRSGNGHIRYLLITLEDYAAWYDQGANGTPKCKDKTQLFDFSNTTLEHLYPRSADGKDKDAGLESVKHDLGNLTILGLGENDKMANKSFALKKAKLAASNIKLNRDVAAYKMWSAKEVKDRTDKLVQMALKVFVP
jgi:uncharacterized protein DUF262/uncharacterized protein DUF1524